MRKTNRSLLTRALFTHGSTHAWATWRAGESLGLPTMLGWTKEVGSGDSRPRSQAMGKWADKYGQQGPLMKSCYAGLNEWAPSLLRRVVKSPLLPGMGEGDSFSKWKLPLQRENVCPAFRAFPASEMAFSVVLILLTIKPYAKEECFAVAWSGTLQKYMAT